jgi:regulator-associated protein of mTOR
MLLQALLSQSHRVHALQLLRGFLRLGGWAVQQALNVGIFQYVAKLLHSSAPELRPLLLHVWAAILSFDRSCQAECLKADGHVYFLHTLECRSGGDLQAAN